MAPFSLGGTSILVTLFFSSFFCLPLSTTTTTTLTKLILEACATSSKDWNQTLCLETLESNPWITSSPDMVTLAITIIEAGLENSTGTRSHIHNMLKNRDLEPGLNLALKSCASLYDLTIGSFKSALVEVKEMEYEMANYDVFIAEDYVDNCAKESGFYEVSDLWILTRTGFVKYFCLAANVVTTHLCDKNMPPPIP